MHTFGILSANAPLTLQRLHAAIRFGVLPDAKIGLVISYKPEAPMLKIAQQLLIPHQLIAQTDQAFEVPARQALLEAGVQTLLLIGYMRKVKKTLLDTFPNQIFNLHGGPLPRFGGPGMIQDRTQAAVLAAGVPYSGPTIHIVDDQYDHGPILAHWPVRVRPNDTPASLNDRCTTAGIDLYISVLRDHLHRLRHPQLFE